MSESLTLLLFAGLHKMVCDMQRRVEAKLIKTRKKNERRANKHIYNKSVNSTHNLFIHLYIFADVFIALQHFCGNKM